MLIGGGIAYLFLRREFGAIGEHDGDEPDADQEGSVPADHRTVDSIG